MNQPYVHVIQALLDAIAGVNRARTFIFVTKQKRAYMSTYNFSLVVHGSYSFRCCKLSEVWSRGVDLDSNCPPGRRFSFDCGLCKVQKTRLMFIPKLVYSVHEARENVNCSLVHCLVIAFNLRDAGMVWEFLEGCFALLSTRPLRDSGWSKITTFLWRGTGSWLFWSLEWKKGVIVRCSCLLVLCYCFWG